MDERASQTGSPLRNIGLLAVAQAILGSNQAIIMSIASLTAATMVAAVSEAIDMMIAWFEPRIAWATASRPILRSGDPVARSSIAPYLALV